MADSGKVIYMIKMKRIFAAASAVVMAAGMQTALQRLKMSEAPTLRKKARCVIFLLWTL